MQFSGEFAYQTKKAGQEHHGIKDIGVINISSWRQRDSASNPKMEYQDLK